MYLTKEGSAFTNMHNGHMDNGEVVRLPLRCYFVNQRFDKVSNLKGITQL